MQRRVLSTPCISRFDWPAPAVAVHPWTSTSFNALWEREEKCWAEMQLQEEMKKEPSKVTSFINPNASFSQRGHHGRGLDSIWINTTGVSPCRPLLLLCGCRALLQTFWKSPILNMQVFLLKCISRHSSQTSPGETPLSGGWRCWAFCVLEQLWSELVITLKC